MNKILLKSCPRQIFKVPGNIEKLFTPPFLKCPDTHEQHGKVTFR